MRSLIIFFTVITMLIGGPAIADDHITPSMPVATFSIVCYDSVTGQFGAAVQSHWFKVSDVIWARPGVGAVATQSLSDFRYGPLGLDMMQMGKTAQEALDGVMASDPENNVRQVAMIDAHGNVAVHTGDHCIQMAGDHTGKFYSVQANLMEKNTVWGAMAHAFETTKGDLAERMMAALDAAQAEGGDIRGKQSAAMLVVRAKPTGMEWSDKLIDIRVDDSPEPLVELRRLLDLSRAYDHMDSGDVAISKKQWDLAQQQYSAAAKLAPGNLEIRYWEAVGLVTAGQVERALPIFKDVFAADKNWKTLTPRLVDAELLPNDTTVINQIMAQ